MKDYSVISAYDLARIESFFSSRSATKLGGSSDLNIQVKHWKSIWAINCPNKMKIVIWRMVHNCLPNGQQLMHHRVPVEGNRVFCCRPESVEHLFLFCPYTEAIWNLVKTQFLSSLPEDHSVGYAIGSSTISKGRHKCRQPP
jgi:hypothetical protein